MVDRRERIVAAAREIAAGSGIAALSVRGVAQRAGVGVGTLRHYFPSQQDLFDEVLGGIFDEQLDDLDIRDDTVPAQRRLAACMRQFLPKDDGHVPGLEGWFALYASAIGRDRTEAGSRLLTTFGARARSRVDGWLAALGTEESHRHRDAVILLALVDGLCLQLLTPGSRTTVQDAHDALDDVIAAVVVSAMPDGPTSDAVRLH